MWLARQLTGSRGEPAARRGEVTGYDGRALTIRAGEEHRDAPLVGPYGVTALPAQGAQAVFLSLEGTVSCVGVAQAPPEGLQAGEICLCSAGGARIVLKNDGSILLNGTVIPAAGEGDA